MREDVLEILKDRFGEATNHDESVVEITINMIVSRLINEKKNAPTWSEKCVIQKIIDDIKY